MRGRARRTAFRKGNAWLLAVLAACAWAAADGMRALAAGPAEPYTIAVHISSEAPPATGPEEVAAIRDFVIRRTELLNAEGGINGQPIRIELFDDRSDPELTKANVDKALADPRLIAMVGLWNSSRGAHVVERIGASGVPLISELSVETLFQAFPNIYTLTRSARDEQEVFANFARDGFKRIAFVGNDDDLYTHAYFDHLSILTADVPVVSTFWLKGALEDNEEAVAAAIEGIKQSGADLIFLSIGSKKGAPFLKRLSAAGIDLPVFIGLGSINGIVQHEGGGGRDYAGSLYEIAEGGIANLNNERLEQLMRRPDTRLSLKPYSPYAVGYGARYGDLVALVAEAASKSPDAGIEAVRNAILGKLSSLREGRSVWRGWAQDWSFTRERASSERSLLVWRTRERKGAILAPMQYVRSEAGMTRVPVLYVHLDMARIFHVDSSDKSFEAEFFFTMQSQAPVPISAVEFTNAERSSDTAAPVISIREVYQDSQGASDGTGTHIYKVQGRFSFEPDLRKYPFDEQIFTVSFQPARTSSPFFLQPPSEATRGHAFRVDGWRVSNHYVGTNELIIRSIDGPAGEESVIPYYNFNYTWVMRRQVIDYVLRVIVPLTFIMIVAYVANFIPRSEFEAIMGIQVTSLLSAIALYLALSQPGADEATLSDIIFVMTYAAISSMIALSVLEVNSTIVRSDVALRIIHVLQMYLVPVVALVTIGFVLLMASNDLTVWEALKNLRP